MRAKHFGGIAWPRWAHPLLPFVLNIVIAVLVWSIVLVLADRSLPTFGVAEYSFGTGVVRQAVNPVIVPPEGEWIVIDMPVDVGWPPFTRFHLHPDDCMESMWVNGEEVDGQIAKFCDHSYLGPVVDLSSYLQPGQNTFRFLIRDMGGLTGVRVTPARNSVTHVLLLLCAAALCLWIGVSAYRQFGLRTRCDPALYGIFLGGVLLRVFYFLTTPYSVRGHDTDAHIQYIEYVARYFRIPPASGGWEYHQAPIYYFLTGQWYRIADWLGMSRDMILSHVQAFSLFVSAALLALCVWIAYLLFPSAKGKIQRRAFLAVFAVLPSVVFLSARISNDVLAVPATFLIVALLLQWWRSGKSAHWYALCFAVGASVCVKISAALFVPVIFGCLLLQPGTSFAVKMRRGIAGAAMIGVLTIWLFVLRFLLEVDSQNSLTFGSQVMHPGLRLPTMLRNFLIFNPAGMFLELYNDPWSDAYRRQFFWEYLFRSAFFGEFQFDPILRTPAVAVLFSGLALLPAALIGFVRAARAWRRSLPLLLTVTCVLGAHLAYRLYAPFSSNQDFRFSVVLAVPVIWGLMEAYGALRHRPWKTTFEILILAFVGSCGAFLLLLALV